MPGTVTTATEPLTRAVDVLMPRLSDSMEEGTILTWLREAGSIVQRGDDLVEIESDKATLTHPADAEGALEIVVRAGETVPVGVVIARLIGPAGTPEPLRADAGPSPVRDDSGARREGDGRFRVAATPLARRIARQHGVDLAAVAGSGPQGRIVRADVEAATASPTSTSVSSNSAPDRALVNALGAVSVQAPTRVQSLIARRMVEAKSTVPEFTVTVEVDAEAALEAREALRERVNPSPSLNDFIIKASARALREHPAVNGSFRGGAFERYERINVGMAVAAPGTLVVPTIFDADRLSLTEIALRTRQLLARVRDSVITPAELEGGTFTVSNLGMFGVARFVAVINPPQAAILSVGAALPRAVFGDNGAVERHRIMDLTLTADHRVIYGADAAAFLATVRDLLEAPLVLLA